MGFKGILRTVLFQFQRKAWRRRMKTVEEREKAAMSVGLSWRSAMLTQAALRKE